LVTGSGTGGSIDVTGSGTGSSIDVTGSGTGSSIQVTGSGTGSEAIIITLPDGTGMSMEISLGCSVASVTIVDESWAPIVSFGNVPVLGETGLCSAGNDGFDAAFVANPGRDFQASD
jgi:hypothetical protein